jgi:hypothetical protein
MLKFHNGTTWVNVTGCSDGKQCYKPNSDDSCPGGKKCYTPDSDGSCPSGKTCQVLGTTIYGGMYNSYSSYNFYTGKWDASTDGSCPDSSYNNTTGTTQCSYPYAQMMSSQSGPYDCVLRCFQYTTPHVCTK